MDCAPIALFVYNRPWHTRQVVEALLANTVATESPLYIFSDGPRNAAASHDVMEVRAYIRSIKGFKTITIVEREGNVGLDPSVVDGVTRLCEQYGRCIVVEDDLMTSPHFLSYMNDALVRYENEDRIMQIAGYMYPVELDIDDDALLLPVISPWGWATWKRAWRNFDPEGSGYQRLVEDQSLRPRFDLNGNYPYFRMLESQVRRKKDHWDMKWYLSVFFMNGLVLYPKKTLVSNLGFDGTGTNCKIRSIDQQDIDPAFRVASMPESVEVSKAHPTVYEHIPVPYFSIKAALTRTIRVLRRISSP